MIKKDNTNMKIGAPNNYKKIIYLFITLFACFITMNFSYAYAESPVLLFSDLESGPKTGWEGSTTKGAAVTIWGKNFGSTRGNNYVSVNGSQITEYAEWGAIGPARGDERITFWLNNNCQDGVGEITVTIDGNTSNALPFTVRSGDIYFVANEASGGSDSNNGRYDTDGGGGNGPWLRACWVDEAMGHVTDGDVVYIRGGQHVAMDAKPGAAAWLILFDGKGKYGGSAGNPIALVGHPEDIANNNWPIMTRGASYRSIQVDSMKGQLIVEYYVFAKLYFSESSSSALSLSDTEHMRIVGNRTEQANQDTMTGVALYADNIWYLDYLGNYHYQNGYDKYMHDVYINAYSDHYANHPDSKNINIAYNEFRETRSIGADAGSPSLAITTSSTDGANITYNVNIYGNLWRDCEGQAIGLRGRLKDLYFYNNIFNNANSVGFGRPLIRFRAWHATVSPSIDNETIYFYNNTIYDPAGNESIWYLWADNDTKATIYSKNNTYFVNNNNIFEFSSGVQEYINSDNDAFYGQTTPTSNTQLTVTSPVTLLGDPFIDNDNDDLHLNSTAGAGDACKDAGTSDISSVITEDYDYNLRPMDGKYDIGAYEYTGTYIPSTPDTEAPSIPSGLAATAISSTQIDLSWNASTDNVGVTGYRIYRDGSQVGTTTSINYSDTGLSPSTTYTYTVEAYDAAGNSALSASVSAATPASPDTEAPSIPSGLAATSISSTQIDLSWNASTDNVGVTGYRIYRDGSQIGTSTSTSTSYSNTGLSSLTTYTYTVKAYDAAANESAASASASATTLASPDTEAPTVPSGLNAAAASDTEINLSWNSSTDNVGVTEYRIYRNGIQIDSSSNTTYTDINLSPSTTFTYTVRAYDASGNESADSSPVSATTLDLQSDSIAPSYPLSLSIVQN